MSNPANHPARSSTTRWWWVRHAPVREDGGCIYGQKDLGCDTSDRVVFAAVGKILPRNAVWVCEQSEADASDRGSDLGRRLSEAGGDGAGDSLRRTASRAMAGHESRRVPRQPAGRQPLVCRYRRARAGRREFHGSLSTACAARSLRINAEHAGRDIIAVAHGGTIKAAIGLALGESAGEGPRLRHRQLFGDAARSFRQRRPSATGGCRWSTSSPGSRMPRTPRCISRPGRKSCRKQAGLTSFRRLSGQRCERIAQIRVRCFASPRNDAETNNIRERDMTLFDM